MAPQLKTFQRTEHVKDEIRSQLKRAGEKDGQVRAIIDMVGSEKASDVYPYGHEPVNGKHPKRTPDASLSHAHAQYPSIHHHHHHHHRDPTLAAIE
jgi:hypothetical protein